MLKWTTDKPNTEGLFWYSCGEGSPYTIEIHARDGILTVNGSMLSLERFHDPYFGKWAGPILVPKD